MPARPAGRRISKDCKGELRKFKLDRITNLNKDVPLGAAAPREGLEGPRGRCPGLLQGRAGSAWAPPESTPS